MLWNGCYTLLLRNKNKKNKSVHVQHRYNFFLKYFRSEVALTPGYRTCGYGKLTVNTYAWNNSVQIRTGIWEETVIFHFRKITGQKSSRVLPQNKCEKNTFLVTVTSQQWLLLNYLSIRRYISQILLLCSFC